MFTRCHFVLPSMLVVALLAAGTANAHPEPSHLVNLSGVTNGAGEPIALGDLRGKVIVLDIWASWCAPCVTSLPDLQAIAREMRGHGVRIVPISIDREGAVAAVRAYARKDIRSLPLYVGPTKEIMQRFGINGIPFTVVYDSRGRVVARFQGAQTWEPASLRQAITKALAAK